MKQKFLLTLSLLVMLSLLTTGLALAKDTLPTWMMAIDHNEFADLGFLPIDFDDWPFHGYAVSSMETLNSHLFAYAASWDGGKILRSADGETWTALTDNGFGLGSFYTGGWDMIAFDDMLYISVGSLYASVPSNIARSADGSVWEPVLELEDSSADKFGLFDGMLYATTTNPGQIWRSQIGDAGTWEMVFHLGEDVSRTTQLIQFKDWLYVNSSNQTGTDSNEMTLYRTQNGLDWQVVPILTVDLYDYDGDLAVHQGYLYLSTGNWAFLDEGWENYGGRIYRTKNGIDWEVVTADGFGDVENYEISGLFSFQDDLYATVSRDFDGAQVWRSHKGDPATWVQVASGGWEDPDNNWGSLRNQQAAFKGELYIAGWSTSAPVWKMVP